MDMDLNKLIENYMVCLEMFELKTNNITKNFWKENIEYWKKRINKNLKGY